MVLCVCCTFYRWAVCFELISELGDAAHSLSFGWRIPPCVAILRSAAMQAVFASGAFFTLAALVEVFAMLLIGLRIPDTDILMQAGAARLIYVVFSNLIQICS